MKRDAPTASTADPPPTTEETVVGAEVEVVDRPPVPNHVGVLPDRNISREDGLFFSLEDCNTHK